MPVYGSNSLISFDSTGASGTSESVDSIVAEKLKFFLGTNKGEVLNNPDYGANLIIFVGLPLDQGLVDAIDGVIRAELGMWFPYVTVDGIEKTITKEDGSMEFLLYYELNGQIQSVSFYV